MRNNIGRVLIFAVLGWSISSTALAERKAPPPYCQNNPGFNDFDFWLGEWNVYSNDAKRQYQGTNSITKHHADCLLKENWQSAGGSSGFSINYFNPVNKEWRQVWVANGYSIDYSGSLNKEKAMVLEGKLYDYREGSATPFRGIWTPQKNGSVVQHFDIYSRDSGKWKVWFEGLYVKKVVDTELETSQPQ